MRHAILTGFPGFIAGQLIERIAPRAEQVTLLVEGRFADRARFEAGDLAGRLALPADRLAVVTGDITRPDLGLEPEVAERLLADADTLFHLAAIYDLAVPAELAERVNVQGTEQVNDFVRRMERLERYSYISTFAVAGRRTGVIREAELEHDAGFYNHYEETKYRAEVAVRRLIDDGLPVSIFRPAVVVGRSTDGKTVKFDGPYMLMKVIRKLPFPANRFNFGLPDLRFQMVPVDFIIDAIATITGRPGTAGKTFHLTDPEPCTTAEINDMICREMFGRGTVARLPGFATRLTTQSGLLTPLGLQAEASPYFFHRASYDCVNTLDALDGTGVECPHLSTYIGKIVEFFVEHAESGPPAA